MGNIIQNVYQVRTYIRIYTPILVIHSFKPLHVTVPMRWHKDQWRLLWLQFVSWDTCSTLTCCIAARALDTPYFCSPNRTSLSTFRWRGKTSRALAGSRDSAHTFLALATSGDSIATRPKTYTAQVFSRQCMDMYNYCILVQLIVYCNRSVSQLVLNA